MQGIFDSTVQADLMLLNVRRCCEVHGFENHDDVIDVGESLNIVLAVTYDMQSNEAVFPHELEQQLKGLSPCYVLSAVHVNAVVPRDDVVAEVADEQLHESPSIEQLIKEQRDDISLKDYFVFASVDKGDFEVCKGLLYNTDHVLGQIVDQLCLPRNHRGSVLKLAHDSVFGGHMGRSKMKERIRLSFFWSTLMIDVNSIYLL